MNITPGPAPRADRTPAPRPLSARSTWHLGANAPVIAWLAATVVVAVAHREIPASTWLLVHMTLLGAVTNAVCVWSAHFADALLRRRITPRSRRWQAARLVALNLGVVTTVVGMITSRWAVTLAGAVVVGLAVAAHALTLWLQSRTALAPRFLVCVRFYVAAGALLPLGAALGVILARGAGTAWHVRLALAHAGLNLLGFVGLTVVGTLVTLWPTMLRTTMDDAAPRAARRTLVLMLGGLAVGVVGALVGLRLLAAAGVVVYVAGIVVSLVPMVASARRRPPSSFATWSAGSALTWLLGSLTALVAILLASPSWVAVSERAGAIVAPLVGGFAAQLVLGALTYLVPVVLGGGPATVRATVAGLERGAVVRVVVANGGLLLFVLPGSSTLAALTSIAALVALASFLPVLGLALRDHRRARRAAAAVPVAERGSRPALAEAAPVPRRSGALVAGLSVLLLVVAGATAIDPGAASTSLLAGGADSEAPAVAPTGRTTTVAVEARDMAFTPSEISVPAGDRLVLTVTNTDPTTVHDLALDTGHHSGRIGVGETVTIDVGVVDRTIEGWCTIVGHRQSGMTLTVTPTGLPAAVAAGDDHGGHTGPSSGAPAGPATASAAADIDLSRAPAAGFQAFDARLAPVTDEKVHRVTLEVSDQLTEVAPGVTQTLWTFGGSAPGPVLHGKVGDRFEITLVNDGSIGHSIDFHAGALAPDEPMRTIAPGETLTYRFTATRAGIWMYHCSTMPMSAHIANGMFGAVIIDPPDLPAVDHEFVLVQSEMYLGPQGGEVDAERVGSGQPDLVTFNGYADGYVHDPLEVRVGDRVRVWVLAAGPNVGSSFHVVGGQFDTVFHEGAYTLRPDGADQGGAQALGLTVAQGGFVELELPEAGSYPFVTHVMSDAERGARGVLAVAP